MSPSYRVVPSPNYMIYFSALIRSESSSHCPQLSLFDSINVVSMFSLPVAGHVDSHPSTRPPHHLDDASKGSPQTPHAPPHLYSSTSSHACRSCTAPNKPSRPPQLWDTMDTEH
ncbi:hypothetical protein LINGRAPRIM_LOCUS78 [Linum grandiflorum]